LGSQATVGAGQVAEVKDNAVRRAAEISGNEFGKTSVVADEDLDAFMQPCLGETGPGGCHREGLDVHREDLAGRTDLASEEEGVVPVAGGGIDGPGARADRRGQERVRQLGQPHLKEARDTGGS
jgi:hypothetical protein